MFRHNNLFLLLLFLLWLLCCPLYPAAAVDSLSSVESNTAASAQEPSRTYAREHIVLVWPETMDVTWYPESRVNGPEQLADWLETCYGLCRGWLGIDPNRKLNANKRVSQQARLIFIHNGMRDYNFGGVLTRPLIGLRDFSGVGSEDWFGWLTHELSHEFFLRFPAVTGTPDDNAWHEALCDYLRYWLLKESGMPQAAQRWRDLLKKASPQDPYKGGADAIMDYHTKTGCTTPADLWKAISRKGVSKSLGQAPWLAMSEVETTPQQVKIEFDAVIDGSGSFTFRDGRIYYDHFTWDYPTQVKINGKQWRNLDKPFELDSTPDFASAKAAASRGRNTMVLRSHQDRLVLFIDDFESSSSHYQITIIMEKQSKP